MHGIVGAHHTSFTVANLDLSLTFFRDVLGLEVLGSREVSDAYSWPDRWLTRLRGQGSHDPTPWWASCRAV